MLVVTTIVDAPEDAAQAVKEQLAMCLEEFDDIKSIKVTQVTSSMADNPNNRTVIATAKKVGRCAADAARIE